MTAAKNSTGIFPDHARMPRQVTLCHGEGDRLVADSMLSALVGLSTLLTIAEEVSLHVDCEYTEDCERIMVFMTKHRLDKHP
jgi:hypothetical protein